jgi:hypothetical protein
MRICLLGGGRYPWLGPHKFVLSEMAASFLELLDYRASFELAIDVFVLGLPALNASSRPPATATL